MSKAPAYIRSLTIMYAALIAGQTLFLLVSLFLLVVLSRETIQELGSTFLPVALVVSAGSISAGYFLFRKKMQVLSQEKELATKLKDYRSALITRFALFETPTMLCTLFYLISGNSLLVIMAVLSLLHFILHRPTQGKLIQDLQLDFREQQKVEEENS